MNHIMRLNRVYFNLVIQGKKRAEIRLNDSKRKLLSIGDTITFLNRDNENESIIVTVDDINVYSSFRKVFLDTPSSILGWYNPSINDMLKNMYEIYDIQDEIQFGIIKIDFHK